MLNSDKLNSLLDGFLNEQNYIKYEIAANLSEVKSSQELAETDFFTNGELCLGTIFDALNKAILEGDFIPADKFITSIQDSHSHLEKIRDSLFLKIHADLQETIKDFLIDNLIQPLRLSFNLIIDTVTSIKRKLTTSHKAYLWSTSSEIARIFNNTDFGEIQLQNIKLLSYNLKVALLDFYLDNKNETALELNLIYDELGKDLNIKSYSSLIKAKCGFLLDKLILRKQKELKLGYKLYYIHDAVEKSVQDVNWNNNYFSTYYNYAKNHYELNADWERQISTECDTIFSKDISNLSYKEVHILIKYYKDISRQEGLLAELVRAMEDLYQKKRKENEVEYLRGIAINVNYALNNEFSVICENINRQLKDVDSAYNHVINIQEKTQVYNFFPHYKYLDYLVKKLKLILESGLAVVKLTECIELFEKSKLVIDKYQPAVGWTQDNYNFIYQLNDADCFIQIEHPEVKKIFLSSTFSLPLPEDKYLEEFTQLRREVMGITSTIRVLINVEAELNKFNEASLQIKDATSDMKNKELKTMEILGIFTALISFIAASIQTFSVVETPLHAAYFMLSLSTSLVFFIFLILLAARGLVFLQKNKIVVLSMLALVFLFWLMFYEAHKT